MNNSKKNLDTEAYLGKVIVVGLVSYDTAGKPLGQTQIHGKIARINETEGIVISLDEPGKEFCIPPDIDCLQKAASGEFRESISGEVIKNPDFISMWELWQVGEGEKETWRWEKGPKIKFPSD